jgi:hypothetical protein
VIGIPLSIKRSKSSSSGKDSPPCMKTWSIVRFGTSRVGSGAHSYHLGLQICEPRLPTLLISIPGLSVLLFLISTCLGSLAPCRLQIRMKLPTLGLTVPFGTTSRAVSSALRRIGLTLLALLLQVPGLATLEARCRCISSMRR